MPEFEFTNVNREMEVYGYDSVVKSHCRMCHGGCGVIVYTTADAAREAEQTMLKGSTTGLAPEAAVAAVFASQPALRHVIAVGQIRIEHTGR